MQYVVVSMGLGSLTTVRMTAGGYSDSPMEYRTPQGPFSDSAPTKLTVSVRLSAPTRTPISCDCPEPSPGGNHTASGATASTPTGPSTSAIENSHTGMVFGPRSVRNVEVPRRTSLMVNRKPPAAGLLDCALSRSKALSAPMIG